MMARRLLILLVLLTGVLMVSQAQDTEPARPDREIYTVLAYGDGVFEPDVWLASAREQDVRTIAEWRADSIGGLAYLDYMHFDAGINADQLEATFGEAWFQASFSNYQNWRELTNCQLGNVRLHEFSLSLNNIKYTMRYWIEAVSETRVLTLFIIFPTDTPEPMDEYAQKLFPDAAVCAG